MNILKPQAIEDYIIKFLQKKSLSGAELLKQVQEVRSGTTKQALYAALRKLKAAEIIVMANMRISLSSVWVINMTEFFQLSKYFYTQTATGDDGFLNLEEGERVSYIFKSPHTTDIFWGHAFDILSEVNSVTEPIYIYNPHEWFFLVRYQTEKILFEKIKKTGKQILLVAGGKTFLDKMITKEFDGTITQYYPSDEKIFEKRNYYVNIFGDFIIEAFLDESSSKKIDDFYNESSTWNDLTRTHLQTIVSKEGKNKLIISKNKRKAEKLKKVLGKYFYIKS